MYSTKSATVVSTWADIFKRSGCKVSVTSGRNSYDELVDIRAKDEKSEIVGIAERETDEGFEVLMQRLSKFAETVPDNHLEIHVMLLTNDFDRKAAEVRSCARRKMFHINAIWEFKSASPQ
jgi:hypothetical protein